MTRKDIDWSIIRGALISVVMSLVVSSALVAGSYYFKQEMEREYNKNNVLFMNISRRYLAIDEEEKRIRKYFPEFIDLYNRGVIGHEQRLNWIEVIKETESSIKLPSMSFNISSQKKYSPPFPIDIGRYQLYSSEMTLKLSLLHEGDFLKLLEGMDERANGIFSVDRCKFSKGDTIILDNPKAPNVAAECVINWYTIKLADGTEIEV